MKKIRKQILRDACWYFIEKVDNADIVEIDAHSFYKIAHTDYIPRYGGDGRTHLVPVLWYEYLPLINTTKMLIKENEITRNEYEVRSNNEGFKNIIYSLSNSYKYERGIFASLLTRKATSQDVTNINTYLSTSDIINIDDKVTKVIKEIVK